MRLQEKKTVTKGAFEAITIKIMGGMEFMKNKVIGIIHKTEEKINGVAIRTKSVLANESGDQFTGFLIMVLLVVVVGAAFLILYQNSITDIWNGVINKIKSTFGI